MGLGQMFDEAETVLTGQADIDEDGLRNSSAATRSAGFAAPG